MEWKHPVKGQKTVGVEHLMKGETSVSHLLLDLNMQLYISLHFFLNMTDCKLTVRSCSFFSVA